MPTYERDRTQSFNVERPSSYFPVGAGGKKPRRERFYSGYTAGGHTSVAPPEAESVAARTNGVQPMDPELAEMPEPLRSDLMAIIEQKSDEVVASAME